MKTLAIVLTVLSVIVGTNSRTTYNVHKLNKFSVDIFNGENELETRKNTVFSPLGILTVFSMILLGAGGNTFSEMVRALDTPHLNEESISHTVVKLVHQAKNGTTSLFSIANEFLVSDEHALDETFLQRARNHFGNWDLIKFGAPRNVPAHFLHSGALSGISVQNLAYFNGKWHHKFTKSQEKMMDFIPFGTTNEDEDDVLKTPCLYTHGRFRSANLGRLDARVLQLPFEGHRLSLLIFLPNRGGSLRRLESNLLTALKKLDSRLHEAELFVAIPRVRVETLVDVVQNLRKMGVKDLFSRQMADLSFMSKSHGLHLAHFSHRSFFEFNEEGSQDNATIAGIEEMEMGPNFVARHPFVYIIRDNESEMILFIGRYLSPLLE